MDTQLREAIAKLSVSEQIDLALEILENLHNELNEFPLTQYQMQELEQRSAEYEQENETSLSWEEVKAEVRRAR